MSDPFTFSPERIVFIEFDEPNCTCGRPHELYRYPLSDTCFLDSKPMMELVADTRQHMSYSDLEFRFHQFVTSLTAHQKMEILNGAPWPPEPPQNFDVVDFVTVPMDSTLSEQDILDLLFDP